MFHQWRSTPSLYNEKASTEMCEYIDSLDKPDDLFHPVYIMINCCLCLKYLIKKYASNNGELNNREDK